MNTLLSEEGWQPETTQPVTAHFCILDADSGRPVKSEAYELTLTPTAFTVVSKGKQYVLRCIPHPPEGFLSF